MLGSSITNVQLVNLIVGVLLPVVVALVTKYESNARVKAVLLLVLAGVTGVLNSWLVGPHGFDWAQAIWSAVTTFIIGVAALFGLWMPTGVNDTAKRAGVSGKHRSQAGQYSLVGVLVVVLLVIVILILLGVLR